MLRTFFFLSVFTPATIAMSLAALALPTRYARFFQLGWSRMTLALAGVRVRADTSALTPGTTYTVFANHQSYLDIPVLLVAMHAWDPRMVAKESLFSLPFFGRVMSRYQHVSIQRDSGTAAMRSIQLAAKRAQAGQTMVIFPEGTRAKQLDKLQKFQVGAAVLAIKAGCPVAPVVICGTGRCLPSGANRIRPGTVRLKALPVQNVTQLTMKDRDAFTQDMYTRMNAAYINLCEESERG